MGSKGVNCGKDVGEVQKVAFEGVRVEKGGQNFRKLIFLKKWQIFPQKEC